MKRRGFLNLAWLLFLSACTSPLANDSDQPQPTGESGFNLDDLFEPQTQVPQALHLRDLRRREGWNVEVKSDGGQIEILSGVLTVIKRGNQVITWEERSGDEDLGPMAGLASIQIGDEVFVGPVEDREGLIPGLLLEVQRGTVESFTSVTRWNNAEGLQVGWAHYVRQNGELQAESNQLSRREDGGWYRQVFESGLYRWELIEP